MPDESPVDPWILALLKSLNGATLTDLDKDISSRALAVGHSLSATPVYPTTPTSGPEAAPASPSAKPADEKETTMPATSGPRGSASSRSAALQSSLESKLRARLASTGCLLYALTWKPRVMLSGVPICRLVASERRTNDSACSSWPTPTVNDSKGSAYSYAQGDHDKICLKLVGAARLASWNTPTVSDANGTREVDGKRSVGLNTQATFATWATPAVKEAGGTPEQFLDRKRKAIENGSKLGLSLTSLSLQAQLADTGSTPTGSSAATAKPGQLNPEHSRWLQGYPAGYSSFAATATRSTRSSPRSSSAPRSKRSPKDKP